jgi:hypothetical protein
VSARVARPARPKQPLGAGGGPRLVGGNYRAGMHAELQKFGRDREGTRQLALLTGIEEPEVAGAVAEVTGLALSVAEDRALSAIQILLDRTGYQGNVPGPGEEQSEAFGWKGTLPRLACSWENYHQAYGLQPDRQGQYRGKAALEARTALESLAEPRRITYRRPRFIGTGKGRKKVFDVIVVHKPLVEITKGYKGLTGQEADAVAAGAGRPSRVTRLLVEVSPLLLDQLDTFHLLKPEGLHQEIERLLGGEALQRSHPSLLELPAHQEQPGGPGGRENPAPAAPPGPPGRPEAPAGIAGPPAAGGVLQGCARARLPDAACREEGLGLRVPPRPGPVLTGGLG